MTTVCASGFAAVISMNNPVSSRFMRTFYLRDNVWYLPRVALGPGSRIGPYEVTGLLGQGGMGEVYRAVDTRLKRTVAIKVLPEAVAADVDRLARFQREAEVLARLNHPNIAQVHGLECSGDSLALVMELVDGPTLADRIVEAPLTGDEVLAIAKQIGTALDAAHEAGIVHRDLKPANIKCRPDGVVKVLDFGLAKALDPASVARDGATQPPTITSPAMMTGIGVLLGTAAYMSPEQARGKPVDKRTDIWAFGAVLYELLTGRRAFAGDDVSDVIASVLAREPDWGALPGDIPPAVVGLVKGCLQKDRTRRIRDIGDVLLALDTAVGWMPADVLRPSAKPANRRVLLPAVIAAAVAALATVVVTRRSPSDPEQPPTSRFEYAVPEHELLTATQRPIVAISPDGRYFAYQTRRGLYVRHLENLEAHLVPGTGEFSTPVFSPDGQWLAFFLASGELRKLSVSGGTPLTICAATTPFGATWSSDNTILYGQTDGIMRVSANGGTPELIIAAGDGEQMYRPQLLPDGRSVLFSVVAGATGLGPARWDRAEIAVQNLVSGQRTKLVSGGSDARYLTTGHLVYALRDGLFGSAFDKKRLMIVGDAVPLVNGVSRPVGVNAVGSNYAVSERGTLIYLARDAELRSIVRIDRQGAATPISAIRPGDYQDPRLSPDGTRLLVTRDGDIWIFDLASGRNTRVTRDGSSLMGVWDPSGSQIAYSSAKTGNLEAWVTPSDGNGQPRQLTHLGGQVHVDSWSPDGHTLTVHQHLGNRPVPIFLLAMDDPQPKPRTFVEEDYNAEAAHFSPDGRYVAYLSNETGQREIFVRPSSASGGQAPVSVGGAQEPVWGHSGEIFYRNLTGDRMYAVAVATAPTLKIGESRLLFEGSYYIAPSGSPRPQYDVSADGRQFVMLAPSGAEASRSRIVVVQNWFEELKRSAPGR